MFSWVLTREVVGFDGNVLVRCCNRFMCWYYGGLVRVLQVIVWCIQWSVEISNMVAIIE